MRIYSPAVSPRLQYVIHFLSRYYGIPVLFTQDAAQYRMAPDACKINYSMQRLAEDEIHMAPHHILFEKGLKPQSVQCSEYNGLKTFFKTAGTFPFDLFAAVFYLLSRYEEYGPYKKDVYGRYAHENALAFRENFLKTPLVNSWLEAFRILLVQKDPNFSVSRSAFSFQPTYDIDIAWSYKAKGVKRTVGGLFGAMVQGKWNVAAKRIGVLQGKETDPFDAYSWLDHLHRRYHLKPLYFFLVAQKRGRFDKNPAPRNALFQNLISKIAQQNSIGLHPSWQSGDVPSLFTDEKRFLERQSQRTVTASRQHYIRFSLPHTYRFLASAGITDDYSMGYGSINGFRASVSTPFYWYDLEREAETNLLIHPFCFMDANAYYEQKQSPKETWDELMHYHKVVKAVNGTLYTIWHNHFLGTDVQFGSWRELYEKFVSAVCTS